MRATLPYALIGLLATSLPNPSAASGTPAEVHIHLSSNRISDRMPAYIQVRLTNTSKTSMYLLRTTHHLKGEEDFSIEVHDLALANGASQLFGGTISTNTGVPAEAVFESILLSPGKSIGEEIVLTRGHYFSHPGSYEIRVIRKLTPEQGGGAIASNSAILDVE